jgi:hypothetical protein
VRAAPARARLAAPLALAAALLVPACSVDVDGAPCLAPGVATDCPGGQACGNDLRCSARAAACAGSRCTPGQSHCQDGGTVAICDGGDPVCGRWSFDRCDVRGMECGVALEGPAAGACVCPEYAGTLVVADAVRGTRIPTALPRPTGSAEPPECRFGRLGDALAEAARRAPEAATVRIEGGADVAFGAEAAEDWPLVVATGVTVVAAAGEPPLVRADPSVATTLVVVRGALEGLRIAGGGAARPGVEVACAGWSGPSLRRVEVDGEGTVDAEGVVTTGLTAGVVVTGACGRARLTEVTVRRVHGVALTIDPDEAGTVEVLGGSYGASNHGIWIRAGKVAVKPDPETAASVVVSGNAMHGVVIGGRASWGLPGHSATVDADIERAVVMGNAGTGIAVASILGASRLRVRTCDLGRNGLSERSAVYGPQVRRAGGMLVAVAALEFVFTGNRVWANGADQLAFDSSGSDWSIAPLDGSCGPQSNMFACMAEGTNCPAGGPCAVAFAGGGSVIAAYNVWPEYPGDSYATPIKVTGVESSCGSGGTLPPPTCP